jgi:hypothetical protein
VRHVPYVGNGPYCYSNSFAMVMGEGAPSTAVIEVTTGGPFGMQLVGGTMPFFDAYGWDPEQGFDAALEALGWTSEVFRGGEPAEALDRLAEATRRGPVWVGPLEMGHLHHQPEMRGPIGADHYVVVLEVGLDGVLVHDPHGYPYAWIPTGDFVAAWRAETVSYGSPFTMRTGFAKVADVSPDKAVASIVPAAIGWLAMDGEAAAAMPPGSLGNAAAATRLAEMVEAGAGDGLREHLMYFAIRVGARRLGDTAACLDRAGYGQAAGIAARQARLVGSLQYPVVAGGYATAGAALRELAPTYDELRAALAQSG